MFEARKTTSKTCSDLCAKKAYKSRKRAEKLGKSHEQTERIKNKPIEDLKTQEFLTVDETARLVRISRRTLYRLIERRELHTTKLGRRTVIRRVDIDKLFEPVSSKPEPIQLPALADCYTITEVLQRYAISKKALYDLIKRNSIIKQYKGKFAYVPKSTIDQLLTDTTQP